ncbi:MAG TPA: undecaprenyldiphospho-muramoylpentapeptide beta-N-acetylglucosaminyltransferase [Beijerinckiaceae bacterium]|nr:undecaprenyldiphospho-muramoylpentapeptide beta-N-acetylglucosaminyltransferase [Beijerinckiaceae bacterium]
MAESRAVLLAAGGTGGHLFPAEATAAALARRGLAVELATDARALKYSGAFSFRAVHQIASATPRGSSLASKARAVFMLARGTLAARKLLGRTKPLCVVGFGGYPTVPPILAASQLRIPSILHEQNAVMGSANRFLAKRVDRLACGFSTLKGVDESLRGKMRHTGNPLRPTVIEAARSAYPDFADGRLRILVTGGSQGARVMSDIAPAAIELLSPALRSRLSVVQQARSEDEQRVREIYARLGVSAEVASFFADLPARMAASHLVIARAGASTVSELAAIGRPSILVPFPFALDQDQAANAAQLAATGAAEVVPQSAFTAAWLAGALERAMADPQDLTRRAEAAKSAGIVDAAERLADLVMSLVATRPSPERA